MLSSLIPLCITIVLAYLCGSLSSAILICRWLKYPDPRSQGSNNPGATNVLRIAGKKAAILTLIGDVLKGFLPVFIAKFYPFTAIQLTIIACSAFLGHLFPIFFRFQGGKGVATAFGVCCALAWPIGLILFITWLIVATITRYSSLAALSAAIIAPFAVGYFLNIQAGLLIAMMSLLLIYRHKNNIQKLLAGTENKIEKK